MKQIIIGIIITVVGGLILSAIQNPTNSVNSSINNSVVFPHATLIISASNSTIEIHESTNQTPYQGGSIFSANSEQIIYLPKGQLLTVNMFGANSDLKISKSVAEQVSVNNSGANSDVSVF